MNILVLNCGSSSIKFQIIETSVEMMKANTDLVKAKGLVERIGLDDAFVSFQAGENPKEKHVLPLKDHKEALAFLLKWIGSPESGIPGVKGLEDISSVGHRFVHGAEKFRSSVLITDEVIAMMEECSDLAPLHNPPNLKGYEAAKAIFGDKIPQCAIYDTAFHATMPKASYTYALPYEWYKDHRVRRYGFHGTSFRFVAHRYRELTGKSLEDTNVVVCHLGNGASMCAIKNGISVDTSMGLTPLEGLVMGTRAGDIDAGIIEFVAQKENISLGEVFNALNKKSGLLGISGLTNDMRDLEAAEENEPETENGKRSKLALDIYVHRTKKYIGSYLAEMNGADAIIFAGGVGENADIIRERICSNLEWFGIEIDKELNKKTIRGAEGNVATANSKVKIFVIPTNEELLIARDSFCIINNLPID